MEFIKKNWDLLLLYLVVIVGVISFFPLNTWCLKQTKDSAYACMILIYPILLTILLGLIFSIITLARTIKHNLNKNRLWFIIIPILLVLLPLLWNISVIFRILLVVLIPVFVIIALFKIKSFK